MSTLTKLDSEHGFPPSGDINTDGYLAVVPSFQEVFIADGRDFDDKGYHRLDFYTTKVVGTADGALTFGEAVIQDSSGVTGYYFGCEDVKLTITGNIGDVDVPFQLGELVSQAVTLAKGYVNYVGLASDGTGFINVVPISRNPTTGALIDFTASSNAITGATSGATAAVVGAVSAISIDKFHYIYRTSTTEFDQNNDIVGNLSGQKVTPLTAADGSPDAGSAIQHVYTVTGAGSSGTFTLTYDGQTTTDIAYNANAATIKTALEVLSTVTVDDIAVTFQSGSDFSAVTPTNAMILTFISTLGSVNPVSGTESMGTATAIVVKPFTTGFTTVTAPPHWKTWKPVANNSAVTDPGIMPDGGSNIGTLCFGRIFLNSMKNPNIWFCSRVGDPLDWDSSQTDVAAATTSQNAKAGEVGAPITAMVAYKDHYLIFGCTNEVWIMRSDPLQGGVNTNVSRSTGFFGPNSWAWDDKNNLYFLGTDGIYMLSAEAIINAQPPVNITKERVPKLVTSMGLNRRTDRVVMGYDKERYGIEISVTQKDGAWSTVFWLDLRTGGIFPDSFPSGQDPASLFYFDSYKTTERGLLMGGYDGFIRKFDEAEKDDEGSNAINSFVSIGPFVSTREPRMKVETNETSLVMGEDTDGITVDIHTGDSGDNVVTKVIAGSTPLVTKTLAGDGVQNSVRQRVSGKGIAIKLKNSTASETWSIEDVNIELKESGRKKV